MASIATPRVLPAHLHAFAPSAHPPTSTVRLLGIITTVDRDQATLTCGSESVTIVLNRFVHSHIGTSPRLASVISAWAPTYFSYPNRDSHISVNSMYEVVGKVIDLAGGQGLGIRVLSTTEWPRNARGELPDLKLFEAVVDVTHRYKTIFYEGGEDTSNGD
ncbi:hypothetical protein DV737_g558, partial [Chaetothyriales sp. CBS 132003]